MASKTYYAWVEVGDNKEGRKAQPSCLRMSVDSGEKHVDTRGNVVQLRPQYDVQFLNGVLTTDDPKAIAMLDDIVKNHKDTITDDYEIFYNLTMPSLQVRQRIESKSAAQAEHTNRLLDEIKVKDAEIERLTKGKK
jgi:hypothetical protein